MDTARKRDADPQKAFNTFIATPQGRNKIFGATTGQIDSLESVAVGYANTRALNTTGDLLTGTGQGGRLVSGGVSAGLAGAAAAALGHGVPEIAGVAAAAPAITMGTGGILHSIANARTGRAGEQVAADIARASPLGRANLANPINTPLDDPKALWRDAITAAVLSPAPREKALDLYEGVYTPNENR
jgi:hypothetical protein